MENTIQLELTAIRQLLEEQNLLRKEILSLSEVANYLQVSASHIYKLTSGGILPHYCPTGKKLYFKRSELDEWLLTNYHETNIAVEKQATNYLIKNNRKFAC